MSLNLFLFIYLFLYFRQAMKNLKNISIVLEGSQRCRINLSATQQSAETAGKRALRQPNWIESSTWTESNWIKLSNWS